MTNLIDGIRNYLKMDNSGALMITGDWGCGKTYHIKNVVLPKLMEDGYNSIMVSLFGLKDVNAIPLKIAENYKIEDTDDVVDIDDGEAITDDLALDEGEEKNGLKKVKQLVAFLGSKAFSLATKVPILSKYVDLKTLIDNNSSILYKLIPNDKTVIFLDDFERAIDTLDIQLLLGVINGLVEQQGYKVVVIANNSYIQEKCDNKELVFKEKVIEKTLVFEPDVEAIFKEICESLYPPYFSDYMAKDLSLEIINPKFNAYSKKKELLADLHNIRILKFALSHFHLLFEEYKSILQDEDLEMKTLFLHSLWACTVGLSVEYKKDRLTYMDKNQFIGYVDVSFDNLLIDNDSTDIQGSIETPENDEIIDDKQEEQINHNANERVSYIINLFIKSHQLPIIISPGLFDLVTAGISLDKEQLKSVWESYKTAMDRNKIDPAYALLNKVMYSQWNMSNEDMEESLLQLTQFVENGAFSDNVSYINSATYMHLLGELIPFSPQEIHDKICAGIDKMYSRMESLDPLAITNLNMIETHIPKESHWVLEYERQKMHEITDKNMLDDINEVIRQFNEDLPALEARLTVQENSTSTPDFIDYPILNQINEEVIVNKFANIQPREVMAICHILDSRFFKIANKKVNDEDRSFVKRLKKVIDGRKPEKKQYSDILIEKYLDRLVSNIVDTGNSD